MFFIVFLGISFNLEPLRDHGDFEIIVKPYHHKYTIAVCSAVSVCSDLGPEPMAICQTDISNQ